MRAMLLAAALLGAQSRLAGHYARTGRTEDAAALYRSIVATVAEGGENSPTLRRSLEPYFELLAERVDRRQAELEMAFVSGVERPAEEPDALHREAASMAAHRRLMCRAGGRDAGSRAPAARRCGNGR